MAFNLLDFIRRRFRREQQPELISPLAPTPTSDRLVTERGFTKAGGGYYKVDEGLTFIDKSKIPQEDIQRAEEEFERRRQKPQAVRESIQQRVEGERGDRINIPGFESSNISADLGSLINNSAKQQGIPPAVLAATLWQESNINPDAKDNVQRTETGQISRDRGIAQINDLAHPDVTDEQAKDPNFAIPYAARLLKSGFDRFGEWGRAIASYNVGKGGAAIEGPEAFGGGPKGQFYLNNVARNLSDEMIEKLNLKVSADVLERISKRKKR